MIFPGDIGVEDDTQDFQTLHIGNRSFFFSINHVLNFLHIKKDFTMIPFVNRWFILPLGKLDWKFLCLALVLYFHISVGIGKW
ncbi:hypothetical protein TNCV_868061 [Trichonephila clavipes]|nr:hypothetical protein TNCV_868061 [Trichonephila clavipes]